MLVSQESTQTGSEFFREVIGGQADQMEAFAKATSTEDLVLRLEACGALLRIHPEPTPTMFHFATLAPAEAEVLRKIRDVVRLGRVEARGRPDGARARGGACRARHTVHRLHGVCHCL